VAESGADLAAAAEVAEWLATLAPAATLVGWGLARRPAGAATVRALDALAAGRGNLGVPGGGVSYYFGRRTAFDPVAPDVAPPRTLAEALLGQEILAATDPPIEVVWVTAGNPVSMLPDSHAVRRALAARFTVVVDTHPTDTTDVADLVLPTLTLLEDEDLLGAYGNHWLRRSTAAVAPPDGARHEYGILTALARRLGVADALPADRAAAEARLTRRLAAAGVTPERLATGPVRSPFAAEVLFADGRFPTANGRMQLLTELPPPEPAPDPALPLRLMATSHAEAQSSQWTGKLRAVPLAARVHPSAAAGFADGAEAWIESARGRLRVTVRHDPDVHPTLVVVAKGGMLRDGRCANALIAARETDAGGGAAFYDEPVRLVAVGEDAP